MFKKFYVFEISLYGYLIKCKMKLVEKLNSIELRRF